MCKKGIAVNYRNEAGRVEDIHLKTNGTKKKIVGNFIGRGYSNSYEVEISKVIPANNKAAKNLAKEVEKLNSGSAKNSA
ncbi:MAG: hypothetical protein PWQ35_5 [Patescibacteria group bacterium]|nr:hypothetical protein [Patescibacteria group bacterium]